MRAAERRVTALCSDTRRLHPMVVYDPPGANRMALVELDDAVLVEPRTSYSTTCSVQLAAPDPRLHDQSWTITETPLPEPGVGGIPAPIPAPVSTGIPAGAVGSPGTVTIDNHGTAEISPVLELIGPLAVGATVIVINAGTTLTFTEAVPADHSVWINCDEFTALDLPGRSVLLDQKTSWRRALTIDGSWPVIPSGQRTTLAFRSPTHSLSARLRAHSRAAWW
ncbi:MAG: hypothetical protein ACT4NY_09020 [Pseudonocardiales bacterium]